MALENSRCQCDERSMPSLVGVNTNGYRDLVNHWREQFHPSYFRLKRSAKPY